MIISFLSDVAYFLFGAQSFTEFAQTFYASITGLCIIIDFVAMCWKIGDVEKLIEKYEEFVQNS